MKRHHEIMFLLLAFVLVMVPISATAAKKPEARIEIPSSVVNIGKENTISNSASDLPRLAPSDFTKELLKTSKVKIENPNLIRILNESAVTKSPLSFGARATIFLGEWALNYESEETDPNWKYQKVNTNFYDNRGGTGNYQIHYVQESQKTVKGGLTSKVMHVEDVQKMMQKKAREKVNLPLSFETIIGAGTKHTHVYNIPPTRVGYLYAFAPAVSEKGKLTYGEVYLLLKGTKQKIVIKNVTTQEIGAWIPIQDHLSFSFETRQ
ncbi:YfkD family protein [Siminovitchia sp. 179-K 8D1 HS]|uniref:YfkD family protein n=1 Tax=Siminovitchia sp. 179-K 8D1 HS TaxID=3142385 RepID=UPI0039A158FD